MPAEAGAPPLAGADLRGANQSLVAFSSGCGAGSAGDSAVPADVAAPAGRGSALSLSAASPSPTGLRTTTGGIGLDPGMLIRIRVVSVVSVFFSSGCEAARPASVVSPEAVGVPYGGVPEG
ncbi:hypothetical protein C3489_25440 [Streptomyces sp. Ru71]|nr:hypothetical protein C3489_25440 [Streptomyces sp. Ru71]